MPWTRSEVTPARNTPTYEFEAIGTHWWLELYGGAVFDDALRNDIQTYCEDFNAQYSRFIDTSLISALNKGKTIEYPPDELLDMMRLARELYDASQGAFDITVGGVLHGLGYGKRTMSAVVNQAFWDGVTCTSERLKLPKNTVIDLGGLGKGWMIDHIATIIREHGHKYFLINGGGDLYVNAQSPVEFALEHPLEEGLGIGSTRIQSGALAVSSPYKRAWRHEGREYHHLIDPRTALPTESTVASGYVRADSAVIADAMASIVLLRPELVDELKERYDIQVILVDKSQL